MVNEKYNDEIVQIYDKTNDSICLLRTEFNIGFDKLGKRLDVLTEYLHSVVEKMEEDRVTFEKKMEEE